jgi:predicted ribosome quality control (RQC) complex YloA/Tae2 family protein
LEFQFARATLRVDFKSHRLEARFRPPAEEVSTDAGTETKPSEDLPRDAHDFPLARALAGKRPERVDEEERRLQQHLKKLRRTKEKVAAEAARGPLAEKYRQDGELLSRNLESVSRGAPSVVVTEYTEEGPAERIIELDPAKTPRQHADWLFHQYRRLKRGVDIASKRLAELDEQIARAQAPEPPSTGLGQAQARPRKTGSSGAEKSKPYREYRASTGQVVWVGRGAKHNDSLTFQIARPHHVWLHARGVPGAHVVVPLEKKQILDQETLLDAAHLAFHFSGYRDEPSGEVSYTFVRYVRNSPAPGAVTYTRESTFWLRVEPDRLRRLLRSIDALPE